MADVLRYFLGSWATVRRHAAFREAPLRVVGRSALWVLSCLFRHSATVELGHHGGRLQLPPRLRRGGATGMFVLREHYEPEIAYVESALAPGMVVIDGGANLGIYTVLASRVVGDSGCVLAFEPGETSFRSLQNNVALNGAHNVRTFKRALSNVSGRARLYHSGGGLVSYSIFPEDGSAGEFEEIETTTIDDTLAAERIDRVDFLKLDVEGAEELALRGAEQLLSRVHPIVMFEMQPGAPTPGDAAHSGAWALLERIGYELYAVADDHTLLPLAAPRAGNNLALPKVGDVLSHAAIKFRLRQIDG